MRQDQITGKMKDLVARRLLAVEDLIEEAVIDERQRQYELAGNPVVWIEGTYKEQRPFVVISSEQ